MDKRVVVMSIKPEYVTKIFNGSKRYEFRKTLTKDFCSTVLIYATAPVGAIVGGFVCGSIYEDEPERVWGLCHRYAGISQDEFYNYFEGRNKAYAYRVLSSFCFLPCFKLEDLGIKKAPQSFCYGSVKTDSKLFKVLKSNLLDLQALEETPSSAKNKIANFLK